MLNPEQVPMIQVSGVLGDSDRVSMIWSRVLGGLSQEVEMLQAGRTSPMNVEIEVHVDGQLVPNNFVGVRTGRFDRRRTRLVVQAAAPGGATVDPRSYLIELLAAAVAEAEAYAKRRGIAESLGELRQLVEQVARD